MRAYPPVAVACAAFALALAGPAAPALAGGPSVAFTLTDPRITESSGLAASRLHPGVYWTHNDSGDGPYVYAVDSNGKTVAKVTMRGVHARDVEAISLGPDGDLYVGDIGDNLNGAWPQVYVYRFPEPRQLRDQTVGVTRYTVRYQDGPRNAEALMVHPRTGRVYIASKNENGGHLYAGPAHLSAKGVNVFRRVADVPWVTDGAFSPDGSRLALRGYYWATDYRWTAGRPTRIGSLQVPMQPQGESLTYTTDGRALMYGSEGTDSEVWREPLSGSDLPDSVTPAPAATAGGHKGTDGAAGGATKDTKSTSGSRVVGVALVAGMGAVAIAVRNSARRRRRRTQE
jgi:hypothetical protein